MACAPAIYMSARDLRMCISCDHFSFDYYAIIMWVLMSVICLCDSSAVIVSVDGG